MNPPKTVLCIHDLSGLGRASLSVILPVLSILGAQPVALPTMVLSSHTGGLGKPARMADGAYGYAALSHYHQLGVNFDYIYSGYLARPDQVQLVLDAIHLWPQATVLVDPVMGDNGKIYNGITPEMAEAMQQLCAAADIIVPNLTEARLLLGLAQPEGSDTETEDFSAETAAALASGLNVLCPQVLVTGIPAGRFVACAGSVDGEAPFFHKNLRQPRNFPGTGDIFASVLLGCMVRGNALSAASEYAARFVGDCIAATPDPSDTRLGVWLEPMLPRLVNAAT